MATLQRIVVGYDFSVEGEVALGQASAVARRAGAELVVAHVVQNTENLGGAESQAALKARALSERSKRLDEVCTRVSEEGVRISQTVVEGVPDQSLVEIQRERGAGLLVVGTQGRSGVRWLLLGSVAERAVRTSPSAVLVARGDRPARTGFRRVLVAMDFSDPAIAGLELALELATSEAHIEILHCWQAAMPAIVEAGGFGYEPELREESLAAAERRGEQFLQRYDRTSAPLDLSIVEEAPRQGIHRRLESGAYDLVALGSRGHRGLQRWLLGSVAESIVRHAPCSVLVAHARVGAH